MQNKLTSGIYQDLKKAIEKGIQSGTSERSIRDIINAK